MSTDGMTTPKPGFDKIPEAFVPAILRVAAFRYSQHEYRMGQLAKDFAKLMATEVVGISQSESDGRISLTIIYR